MERLWKSGVVEMINFDLTPSSLRTFETEKEQEESFNVVEDQELQQSETQVQQRRNQNIDYSKFNLIDSKLQTDELSSIPYAGPGIRGLVSGGLGLPGGLYGLISGAADWVFDNSFGRFFDGSPEESKKRRKEQDSKSLIRFGEENKRFPETTEFKSYIDALTGNKLQPKTRGERDIGKAGEFLGASMAPLGGFQKSLQVPSAIGAAAGGVATQEAEEIGVGPMGQLGIGLATSLLTQSGASKVGSSGKNLADGGWRNILRKPGTASAHIPGIKVRPNSEIEKVVKAAADEGITLPLSAMTEGILAKQVENITSKMTGGRSSYRDLFNKTNKEFVDAYQRNLDKVSINRFAEKFEAGSAAQSELKKSRDIASERVRQKYQQSIDNLPKGASIANNGIQQISKKIASELSESLLPSIEESATRSEFKELLRNLKNVNKKPVPKKVEPKNTVTILGPDGRPFPKKVIPDKPAKPVSNKIPVKKLVATERSLNDLMNYEKQGGSKKLISQAQKKVKEAIKSYSETSPEAKQWYQSHLQAKAGHADLAQRFRNNMIDSALKNERPEFILNNMNSKSGILKVQSALSETQEGKKLFNQLKRFKIEEMIGKKLINPSTGDVKYQAGASALADPKNKEVLKELMGPEVYTSFNNLQKVSSGIQKGFRDFINPSKTAEVSLANTTSAAGIFSIIQGVSTANLTTIASGTGLLAAPYVMGKLLTNKNFLKESARLAQAGNSGNKQNFSKSLRGLIPIIQNVMKDVSEIVEFEGENEATELIKNSNLINSGQE